MLSFAPILECGKTKRSCGQGNDTEKPKTIKSKEGWIKHVEDSFLRADNEQSKLTQGVLGIEGMCGVKNRHFLNNICNFAGCEYVEIGSLAGASLCAAIYDNAVSATAIDNWSQFGGPKKKFHQNIKTYASGALLNIVDDDCFALDVTRLPACNVF